MSGAELLRDLRYAVRTLRRSPLFTAVVVGAFALAIGANTAIFSVVNAAFLRPLPYPDANRLVFFWIGDAQRSITYSFSFPGYELLRDHPGPFDGVAAYDDEGITVVGPGEPERLEGGRVSANFFNVLGVQPILGRTFTPAEDRASGPPLVVLSHPYWANRFHSDPHVLGRAVRIDGLSHTVIGVLPPDFQFLGGAPDLWRSRIVDTSTFSPASVQQGASYLTVIGRLRKGAGLGQAQAALALLDSRFKREHPGQNSVWDAAHVGFLQEQIVSGLRLSIFVTWGAVCCLLLIACANGANLLLSRAAARWKEIQVRLAIGAGRARIARQLLTESVLLSLCAGAIGIPLGEWGVQLLGATIFQTARQIPKAHLDGAVLLFTFGVSLAIGVAFGLAPAIFATRGDLHHGFRSTGSPSRVNLRGVLVSAEVALSLVLLAGAGLLLQSFERMRTMNTGIQTAGISFMHMVLMPNRYESFEARSSFYDEVLRRARATPGVASAAITSRVDVVQPGLGYLVFPEGVPDTPATRVQARGRSISPGYLGLMGIPLLAGRDFTAHDSTAAPKVMLVNESFAARFFPGQSPIGKHVVYSTDHIDCEIVGLSRNVRPSLQSARASEEFYVPLSQRPWATARLLIQAKGSLAAVLPEVRRQVQAADPEQAIADMRMLDDALSSALDQPRSTMSVLIAFASAALLLAAMGIYGVMAYAVSQRAREIGIRMALGADSARVRSLVLRQSMRLVLAGVAVGVPAAALLGRLYSGLLFGVTPADPLTLAAVIAILCLVALAASYVPARRAARVDPASLLRSE